MSVRSFSKFVALIVLFVLPQVAVGADEPVVHVSGQGVVQVAPDQVVIDLTVTTTDDDLIRVRQSSDKDVRAILTIAKTGGVNDNRFEVSRLELSLNYNEQLRRQIYQVERDLTLRLTDLTKLDAVLSNLLSERNLKVTGISFVTSKSRQHVFEARSRAVADAKEKASHLAELNGFKLGAARDIRVISESQNPFVTSIIPVVGAVKPQKPQAQFVAFQQENDDDDADADAKPFALGMIEITADVSIVFQLAK